MPGICKQRVERAAVRKYSSSAKLTAKPNCLISVYTQAYVIVELGRWHRKKACNETCQRAKEGSKRRTHLLKFQDIPHLKKKKSMYYFCVLECIGQYLTMVESLWDIICVHLCRHWYETHFSQKIGSCSSRTSFFWTT